MSKNSVNEDLEFGLTAKIFLAGIAAFMTGKSCGILFKGSPDRIRSLTDAMIASKVFQNELNKPGADIESVVQKLGVKNMTAHEFERTFDVKWPL